MALRLICSVCFSKKHQGFMQETLIGADKEWIHSFSTWDYLLPGGTQLRSDWHASLCQQSAKLAPYTRRQIASLCLLSPSVSTTSWLPLASTAGHRTQINSHSAGEATWSLTCLSFSLLILVFNVNAHCAYFDPKQNVCTAGFFARAKTLTHVQPALFMRNLPPQNQQPQPSLCEHRYTLLQSSMLSPCRVSSPPCHARPALLTPNLEI